MFRNLPTEIIIEILSRLPILAILSCKKVHKEWRNLINTPQFVRLHLSKSLSAPGLAVFEVDEEEIDTDSEAYKAIEIADELSHENDGSVHNPDTVFHFNFLHDAHMHSSVNGFLFLKEGGRNLYICNPVTRDYIELPWPECRHDWDQFGFGVSKITGQYKLVKICSHSGDVDGAASNCEVYTLGTGSWRRTAAGCPLKLNFDEAGAFFNGNLHWLATTSDSKEHQHICCFDLETEQFSTFCLPPDRPDELDHCSLCGLGDCLCFCNTDRTGADGHEIVIWLMKEYGDGNSWSKEVSIGLNPETEAHACFPVKVFKNGDFLFVGVQEESMELWCYSDITVPIPEYNRYELGSGDRESVVTYTPSFIPARSFQMENVGLF